MRIGDRHIRLRLAVVLVVALCGCAREHAERRAPASERERDSTIGASGLPGAQGVRGALRVSDSAASRRAREDSIAANP